MPKHVDHPARREELAQALWRLVMREGMAGASIRRVAAEAGWSSGSVRHYFTTHSELLVFAMDRVTQRVADRIAALPQQADPRMRARLVLAEILPLDDVRRAETQVWLAFTMQAVNDPALRPLLDAAHALLRDLCRQAAEVYTSEDVPVEAERLHALLDGLALHAVLEPETTTPERIWAVLNAHLESMRGRPAPGPDT